MEKFKVGNTVRMKASPQDMIFILEINTQECYSGCEQVWYTGRLIRHEKYAGIELARELYRVSAIEVERIPPSSKERMELEEKIKVVVEKKEAAIRAQNWDEVTRIREEERELKMKLDLVRD